MPPELARWMAQEIARRVSAHARRDGGAAHRGGRARLRETPGFGLEVDWEAAKALRP
jgi:hypothetical protein